MFKTGFDNDKYLKMQSERIMERIKSFGGKLYMEFGGKLFDDHHASRVLPGFKPDSKIRMLTQIREDVEVVVVINSADIEKNKVRGDLGITYDLDVLRLIDAFRSYGLYVGSVVLTRFEGQECAIQYQKKLEALGIKVYRHYPIAGYPNEVPTIISDEGYGKNDYIETKHSLVVVTAPGPGSGKMAVCLSQLYHEHKHGIKAGYAKFETFPVWNLSLSHPVNLAYEAATADLNDVNMIDPYHLEAYGLTTVNYNRDVAIFPVLNAMFEKIYGSSPYKSPTDMGVNRLSCGIIDDEVVKDASKQEVVRRYLLSKTDYVKGNCDIDVVDRLKIIMDSLEINEEYKTTVLPARKKAQELKSTMKGDEVASVIAIELNDGKIMTGKTTSITESSASVILNALKYYANIPDDMLLLAPLVLRPIQELKSKISNNKNAILNVEEVLIALGICATTNTMAEKAMTQIDKLMNCKAHSTTIMSNADEQMFRKLGIQVTSDPVFASNNLYYNI